MSKAAWIKSKAQPKTKTTASKKPPASNAIHDSPASAKSKARSRSSCASRHGTATSENTKKKCGEYNDLSDDKSGNLVVREYKDSKKWYPVYTYVPPVHWDVPQKRADVCLPNEQNYTKLTGLIDRGLPINVLELNQNGNIAHTEDTVLMSNVGSMIPRFNYQEQPFSKPYV